MSTSIFSGAGRPCRYCSHLVEIEPAGFAICRQGGSISRHASPDMGCAFWRREPGSDDDLDHDGLNDACAGALLEHLARQK